MLPPAIGTSAGGFNKLLDRRQHRQKDLALPNNGNTLVPSTMPHQDIPEPARADSGVGPRSSRFFVDLADHDALPLISKRSATNAYATEVERQDKSSEFDLGLDHERAVEYRRLPPASDKLASLI